MKKIIFVALLLFNALISNGQYSLNSNGLFEDIHANYSTYNINFNNVDAMYVIKDPIAVEPTYEWHNSFFNKKSIRAIKQPKQQVDKSVLSGGKLYLSSDKDPNFFVSAPEYNINNESARAETSVISYAATYDSFEDWLNSLEDLVELHGGWWSCTCPGCGKTVYVQKKKGAHGDYYDATNASSLHDCDHHLDNPGLPLNDDLVIMIIFALVYALFFLTKADAKLDK